MNKRILKSATALFVVSIIATTMSIYAYADSGQRWNLGDTTNTGKDNGYSGNNDIDNDDPHYGWKLGQFYVSGYTQRSVDSQNEDVFLKNVGDKVELHFELLQDIDKVNDNENLTVFADDNGYDKYFSTQKFNDCRGLLIIRKTDYQNKTEDPVIYTDYLDGVKQGADTVVEFCEEGDYEVALDYELKEDHYGMDWNTYISIPTYTNYRIFFKFKIRNGNCMVFPFDVTTSSELTNESFTDNGFYLDLANSRYLDINVKRSVYAKSGDGYTEDVRFNRPASDGTKYTEEGIYVITVKNNITNQETTKTIYVGTDPMMRAFVVSGKSLNEIQDMITDGYQVTEDGNLVAPDGETVPEATTEESAQPSSQVTSQPESTMPTTDKSGINPMIIVVGIAVLVVIGAGIALVINRDKLFGKKNNEKTVVKDDSAETKADAVENEASANDLEPEENDTANATEEVTAEDEEIADSSETEVSDVTDVETVESEVESENGDDTDKEG